MQKETIQCLKAYINVVINQVRAPYLERCISRDKGLDRADLVQRDSHKNSDSLIILQVRTGNHNREGGLDTWS